MTTSTSPSTEGAELVRLLLVEDEHHLAIGLKLNFELEGYAVDVAETGREASRLMVSHGPYALIILDVMLPDMDGFSLCRHLRAAGDFTPVIMLTARSSPTDRVRGLESGADDYLPKPFELDELMARVSSLLRRRAWEKRVDNAKRELTRLVLGEATVDFATHEVVVAGQPVRMTRLELDLLHFFVTNPERVLGRQELLESVWQLRNYPNTRTVDNFVLRLRRIFEPDPARPRFFVSVRGSGYRFVPESRD